MFDASRRPIGRLSYWVMAGVMMCGWVRTASGAGAVPPSEPATTTVADTVYLADGNPAQGNLIITWPPFLTASGTAIAGGTTNVALGKSGAERGAGAECRGEPSGRVLHRGVSAGPGANQDRVLDGTDDVAGELGGGTSNAGIGDGGTGGFDAVREFGTGDQGG